MTSDPGKASTSNELAQQRTDLAGNRTNLADERTSLALDRTRLAHDRTLMAWVRTGTSLISFGFTVYKFFQYMRENQPAAVPHRLLSPRLFGMMMIGLGIGALILATIEHRSQMRLLQTKYAQYGQMPRSPTTTIAWAVAAMGVFVFILAALHQ